VGKSSLMNALARRDVAIVSARAGTTRDVIEVHLDLGGYPVVIADTAGIHVTGDDIEIEGVRRARARASQADLRVVLLDARTWPEIPQEIGTLIDDSAIVVVNKIDVKRPAGPLRIGAREAHPLSALTGEGCTALVTLLEREAIARMAVSEAPVLTRLRHRQALEACLAALRRAIETSVMELRVEDLRLAVRENGRITGRVDVEDILDVIFQEFCIGK
jgi:tRNA modification GTPase